MDKEGDMAYKPHFKYIEAEIYLGNNTMCSRKCDNNHRAVITGEIFSVEYVRRQGLVGFVLNNNGEEVHCTFWQKAVEEMSTETDTAVKPVAVSVLDVHSEERGRKLGVEKMKHQEGVTTDVKSYSDSHA